MIFADIVNLNDICKMIAIVKGDIIGSRKVKQPEKWLKPLKELLGKWGGTPRQWELIWGDFFQLEIEDPLSALSKAIEIKALIKSIAPKDASKNISTIDVRMAIGIGDKQYTGSRISESNGPAFVFAGEKFEKLKKEKTTLAVQTPWNDFNEEINLYLRLAAIFMDKWSVSSGELIKVLLQHPDATQDKLGRILEIKQNSVSGRWRRSNAEEMLEVDRMFQRKLKKLIG
jgi:hypothetical protein